MARPVAHRGYMSNGPGVESDVLACNHCQMQMELVPAKGCDRVTVDRCPQCDRAICERCGREFASTLKCVPFEAKLNALERSAALSRRLGLLTALLAVALLPVVAHADSLLRPTVVTTGRPTCNDGRRGTQWTVFSPSGADTTSVCEKLSNGSYSWVALDTSGGSGSGTPASTVESEAGFGVSSAVGTSTDYARADHTHGSPVNPVTAHEGAADPHTGYQRESEKDSASGYAGLDGSGLVPDARVATTIARDSEVASAVSSHESAGDPHPTYLTAAEGAAAYDATGTSSTAIAAHVAAADPHTGYQRESEKSAAGGYASLGATTTVPVAELATGTANANTFLRGDGTWQPICTPSLLPPCNALRKINCNTSTKTTRRPNGLNR